MLPGQATDIKQTRHSRVKRAEQAGGVSTVVEVDSRGQAVLKVQVGNAEPTTDLEKALDLIDHIGLRVKKEKAS